MEDGNHQQADSQGGAEAATEKTVSPRSVDSTDLLAGAREIVIRHGENQYRLRSTNKGKLILTK